MEIQRQVTVNVSADKVWKILGKEFNDVSQWASFVKTSQANPDLDAGELGRVCEVNGFGKVIENIYHYDDKQQELAFTLEAEKNPFFMQRIENSWHVEPLDDDRAVVTVGVQVKLMPVFRQLLSGRLRKMMSNRADTILAELKYYAENGLARPNTQEQAA